MREVWDLSLAISTSDTFDKIRNDLVTVEDFWLHSLYCATIAQAIDLRLPKRTGCPLFPAGLLHDIGHLIMFHLAPEKSSQALELSLDDGDGLTKFEAEQTVFGYDHADVGAALAVNWNLPNYLRYPIEYHHKPFESPEFVDVVTTVHIANCLAILAEVESDDLEDAPPIADGAISRIGLEKNALPQILTESRSTAQSLLRLFTD
jgi:HD-like signal output (HDOD) protein